MIARLPQQQIAEGGGATFPWLLGLWCIIALLMVWWFRRNERVYHFRMDLIDRIHQANQTVRGEWEWRYEEFNRVSYDRMFWEFWKPVRAEAFYPRDPARAEP
jgi:hypothetical protein